MKLLIIQTYLSMIRSSVGTTMFRHVFAEADGVRKDLLEDGQLSCAFYVSSMLSMFHLIGAQHTTVASTVKDLLEHGWREIVDPREGCVLVWESQVQKPGSGPHEHIGLYGG